MNPQADEPDLPPWVHLLGVPAWVSGPDRKLRFVNHAAEQLLGLKAEECVGKPCFQVIASKSTGGDEFCSAHCPVLSRAEEGLPIKPATICVGRQRASCHWLRILSIPLWSDDGRQLSLVDCALDVDRAKAMEDYLSRILARTPDEFVKENQRQSPHLTPREQQVLEDLAMDRDLVSIAGDLHLSHVTVRNHVQHILRKLDVHSIAEAVAWRLVGSPDHP